MADFENHREQLEGLGASVYALSSDSLEDAARTVKRHNLNFPVGYGLDPMEAEQKTGAYVAVDGRYLQATSFILKDARVQHVTYSSGPLGRLQADHAVSYVEYASKGS